MRDGDRFWYQRTLSSGEMSMVGGTRLADVVRRNTTISNLQDNVFVFDVDVTGHVWLDRDGDGRQDRGESGLAGRKVDLFNSDGELVDSVTTDTSGAYHFDNVQIGHFQLRANLPRGFRATTAAARSDDATRGDLLFANINFGQRAIVSKAPAHTDVFASHSNPFHTNADNTRNSLHDLI